MRRIATVLAHQGGWDEALLVGIGIPAVLFAVWKLVDRWRGVPAEQHRWDRDRADDDAGAATDADSGDGDGGE